VTTARDNNKTVREASPQAESIDEDFVIVSADPVRRRLFGDPEATSRFATSVNETSTTQTSTKFSPFWDERQGKLDIPADFVKTLLDENMNLDLAHAFEENALSGKLVTMTFKPVLGIKGVIFPSRPLATFSGVVSLSITYTSLISAPDLFQDLHRCFPSLQHLDLSGSLLENVDGVAELIASGLKILRLKDGKLTSVQGLESVAEQLRSSTWRGLMLLEEVDIRDNEIAKVRNQMSPAYSRLLDVVAARPRTRLAASHQLSSGWKCIPSANSKNLREGYVDVRSQIQARDS
jgi:hypothetical protein